MTKKSTVYCKKCGSELENDEFLVGLYSLETYYYCFRCKLMGKCEIKNKSFFIVRLIKRFFRI